MSAGSPSANLIFTLKSYGCLASVPITQSSDVTNALHTNFKMNLSKTNQISTAASVNRSWAGAVQASVQPSLGAAEV